MPFLRNAWYVAAWPDELGRTLRARRIAGEPLVFFREENGSPICLQDSCPHRFAPLSMSEPGFAAEPVLFNVDTGAVKVRRVMERLIAAEAG